ncbi:MAG: hypothetical protein RL653_1667 [Pseudomonadota bacterium]|jgi:cytochrome c553
MRLFASSLAACALFAGCASQSPSRPAVEDECTLATPLVPGVPGSPGHLVPSDINPNGASELATLMRQMVTDWREIRGQLAAGQPLQRAPLLPTHRKIRCAWPTAPEDRNAAFDAMSQVYVQNVRTFDAAPSAETYRGVLAACAACHEATCGGPLAVIEGLQLPAAAAR